MSIYADPTDANTVYVPEVDALWVSHDGGKAFAKLHTPHGDNHIVWINPHDPKLLLEGNDGGATVSTDGGLTWSGDHNQPTGQFYHVALDDQFPFHIYGAQQDEGSFEGPSAASAGMIPLGAWHSVAYGEATFVAPQPGNPNITYGSGYFSIQLRYDMATGQFREVSPWPEYQEGAASNQLKYRFGWTHPILFSAAKPGELLLASQYVLKSIDGGETWTRISPDLTRNDPATERPAAARSISTSPARKSSPTSRRWRLRRWMPASSGPVRPTASSTSPPMAARAGSGSRPKASPAGRRSARSSLRM
jgi:BNR/Asp-box repeat.